MVMGDAEAEIAQEKPDERVYCGQGYLDLSHLVIQKKKPLIHFPAAAVSFFS
jgi:hypothetical protein